MQEFAPASGLGTRLGRGSVPLCAAVAKARGEKAAEAAWLPVWDAHTGPKGPASFEPKAR